MFRRGSNMSAGASRLPPRIPITRRPSATGNDWVGRSSPYVKDLLSARATPQASQPLDIPTSSNVTEFAPDVYSKLVAAEYGNETASTSGTSFHTPVSSYGASHSIFSSSPVTDRTLDEQTTGTSANMSRNGSLYSKFDKLRVAPDMARQPSSSSQHFADDLCHGVTMSLNGQHAPTMSSYDPQFLGYMGGPTIQHDRESSTQLGMPLSLIAEDAAIKMERNSSSESDGSRLSRRTREQNLGHSKGLTCRSIYFYIPKSQWIRCHQPAHESPIVDRQPEDGHRKDTHISTCS